MIRTCLKLTREVLRSEGWEKQLVIHNKSDQRDAVILVWKDSGLEVDPEVLSEEQLGRAESAGEDLRTFIHRTISGVLAKKGLK